MCSFLKLSNIALCMYHNFCILSPVLGHLGCFHVLAIVNSAPTNIGVHASLSIMVFSAYMPSSGIVGLHDSFIPSFLKESPYLPSSLVAVTIYIPTNSARAFPFLHTLSSIQFVDFLMRAILIGVR